MAKISLEKAGQSHKISLKKDVSTQITANLNWNASIKQKGIFFQKTVSADLDLACMYQLKNGKKGVIQALGNSFGNKTSEPYIFLDGDDRTGSSDAGETMLFTKPEDIEFAIVFAYIYSGVANWDLTGAKITLLQTGEPDIVVDINRVKVDKRFCVIAALKGESDGLRVERVERFFNSHQEVDKAYGFGFKWTTGHK